MLFLCSYAVVVDVMDTLGKKPLLSATIPLVIASRRIFRTSILDVETDLRQWLAGNFPEVATVAAANTAKNEQRRGMAAGMADSEDFGADDPRRRCLSAHSHLPHACPLPLHIYLGAHTHTPSLILARSSPHCSLDRFPGEVHTDVRLDVVSDEERKEDDEWAGGW
jgi:hypothetical protein